MKGGENMNLIDIFKMTAIKINPDIIFVHDFYIILW